MAFVAWGVRSEASDWVKKTAMAAGRNITAAAAKRRPCLECFMPVMRSKQPIWIGRIGTSRWIPPLRERFPLDRGRHPTDGKLELGQSVGVRKLE